MEADLSIPRMSFDLGADFVPLGDTCFLVKPMADTAIHAVLLSEFQTGTRLIDISFTLVGDCQLNDVRVQQQVDTLCSQSSSYDA